jgi:hypothetical protein
VDDDRKDDWGSEYPAGGLSGDCRFRIVIVLVLRRRGRSRIGRIAGMDEGREQASDRSFAPTTGKRRGRGRLRKRVSRRWRFLAIVWKNTPGANKSIE